MCDEGSQVDFVLLYGVTSQKGMMKFAQAKKNVTGIRVTADDQMRLIKYSFFVTVVIKS